VIQKLTLIRVGRYGHFQTVWTSLKDFIGLGYIWSVKLLDRYNFWKNYGKIGYSTWNAQY